MFDRLRRGNTRRERELAWRTQLQIMSHAPVANAVSGAQQLDPDVVLGEAQVQSN